MDVLLCLLGALLIQQASGQGEPSGATGSIPTYIAYCLLCVNGCLIAGVSLELNGNLVNNFGLLPHNDIDTSNDIEDVGLNLVCRTDLTTCCTSADGLAQGSWYYPTGGEVMFPFEDPLPSGQIYRFRRGPQVVRLRRELASTATANGIYRCRLADQNGVNQTRYVGLYTEGAGELG